MKDASIQRSSRNQKAYALFILFFKFLLVICEANLRLKNNFPRIVNCTFFLRAWLYFETKYCALSCDVRAEINILWNFT